MDILVKEEHLARAFELHRMNPVVDAHLDLAGEVLLRRQAGEKEVVKRHYLPHFKEAGLNLVFSSVYVENRNIYRAWENALEQIDALKKDIEGLPVILVKSIRDLDRVLGENKIGILLYMEGLDCIGEDIDRLEELYGLGVRGASLTWSRANALGHGCCKASEYRQIPGRLTKTGERVVKRLEELAMFLDVSHLNDEGFDHVCRLAEHSFIATHSGSRKVYDNYRNLTDTQMLALAKGGGIMGMNGCKYIAGSLEGNHIEMLCRHIEYEVEKIGPEHVGFGFDLCDSYDRAKACLEIYCPSLGTTPDLPFASNLVHASDDGDSEDFMAFEKEEASVQRDDCLLHHGQIPLVTAALLQRGMDEDSVKKIIGGNFIRYLANVISRT